MSVSSKRRRVERCFPPRERYFCRGVPEPFGRKGRRAGIWIGLTLAGIEACYLVGAGESSMHPVALIYPSGPNHALRNEDFRLARAIAAESRRLDRCRSNPSNHLVRDFRGMDFYDCVPALEDFVFFPTDRHGWRVLSSNQNLCYGTQFFEAGIYTSTWEHTIKWSSPEIHKSLGLYSNAMARRLPCHTLIVKKSGVSGMPIISAPASKEDEKHEALTAA